MCRDGESVGCALQRSGNCYGGYSSGLSFGTSKNASRPYLSHAVGDVSSSSENELPTSRCAHSLTKIQEPLKHFGRLKGYKSLTEDPQL